MRSGGGKQKGATNGSNRKENMTAFLQVVEAKYGGAEKYVIERLGFTKDEVKKIRSNLIVDA